MNEKNLYNINYTFYVQSVEDFRRQLREFERKDYLNELEIDTTDLGLSQELLASIGIKCK
jgi:hypothetical protein